MRRACCASILLMSSSQRVLRCASVTAFLVISLNSTRWMFGLDGRELLGDVPGDRLALAIGVGRQVDGSTFLAALLISAMTFFLPSMTTYSGCEVVLDVDADA